MTNLSKSKPKASHGDSRLNIRPASCKLIRIPERKTAYFDADEDLRLFGEIFLLLAGEEALDVQSEFASSLTEDPNSHIETLAIPIMARDGLLPHAEQGALDAITRSCL
jgi:hypothetical protein